MLVSFRGNACGAQPSAVLLTPLASLRVPAQRPARTAAAAANAAMEALHQRGELDVSDDRPWGVEGSAARAPGEAPPVVLAQAHGFSEFRSALFPPRSMRTLKTCCVD